MSINIAKGLTLDLRVYEGNDRNTLNVSSTRTGFVQAAAYVDKRNFALAIGNSINIQKAETTKVFIFNSIYPVTVIAEVRNNLEAVTFENQKILVISDKVGNVFVDNTSGKITDINIIRFSEKDDVTPSPEMPRQLVTFAATPNRIAQLPQNIININNVRVQNVTLVDWQYDQSTAPGTGIQVLNKYRICDSNGTPNTTGNYIMILNDTVSQQNFSGTLQLWVEELS